MTVLGSSGGGKQVFPVDYEAEICQRLVDAARTNDLKSACELIDDPLTNVNLVGTVSLKSRKTEIVSCGELPHEVRVEFEEFKTDVTALFLAAHSGNMELLRKLLSVGGNVNEKVFRGYATTASVREGHLHILEVLINSGASQAACEEALLEASYLGRPRHAQRLMASDMIRPQAAAHALVTASCRGYADVVSTLVKQCGVDANANYRVLLQSSKPCLYANVNCNPLVAAIVSRQINVVSLLLQVGVATDVKVNLGAWSWDMDTGEEFRVGAGLAEAYGVTWCAVEYFEATGAILRMLLHQISPSINIPHLGRTLLHHAILCNNARALQVLINCGADINSVTSHGETGLMICARHKNKECFKLLASSGADFGLLNSSGQSLASIAESSRWTLGFHQVIIDLILEGKMVKSRNKVVFSPLRFVTKTNEVEALKKLLERSDIEDIDEQDEKGFSAAMLAVVLGHVEAFELLLCAGADVNLQNKSGESVMELLEANKNGDKFEKVMVKHWTKTKQESRAVGLHAHALHQAAQQGDLDGVVRLIRGGCDVNGIDSEGNSPLMLAAREGQAKVCVVLMSFGARRDVENARGETALSFARRNGIGSEAEGVILDEEARKLVLEGSRVKKHTKCGKGSPHKKVVRMVEGVGVLRWGKSNRRNVICKAAEVGASERLRWNRRRKFDTDEPGLFHVVTTKNKEAHFVCEGGVEMAQLWVRGIKLVTREAIFGNNSYRLL